MRQLEHSVPDDNNLLPFHLWPTETMLQDKKVSIINYFVNGCLENFLLLPIFSKIQKNLKNVFNSVEKPRIFL